MRTMARITLDTAAANAAIASGELPKLVGAAVEALKPEAAYFFPGGGRRCAVFVFDMKEPSDIAVLFERWFMGVQADIELTPVMNFDDLQAGLQKVGG